MDQACSKKHIEYKKKLIQSKYKESQDIKDNKITYLNIPKFNRKWKTDFFQMTVKSLKPYKFNCQLK